MVLSVEKKKSIIGELLGCGYLISPDFFDYDIGEELKEKVLEEKKLFVLSKDVCQLIDSGIDDANWPELERLRVLDEKQGRPEPYRKLLACLLEGKFECKPQTAKAKGQTEAEKAGKPGIEVLSSYEKESKKKSVENFVSYFNHRYKELEKILSGRQELAGLTAITRVKAKKEKENVSVIGIVSEKTITSNNNIILKLEDPTGEINVLISKNRQDLFDVGKDIVEDEVIGVAGVSGGNIIFSNSLVFPDIPMVKEIKKSPEEEYALFLSDIHVGSDTFMEKEFLKFIEWINGRAGNEKQRELTKKIKYVFIAGDLVDGVGIYPGQDEELIIKDIYEQYKECGRLLSLIPKHIQIVVCAGNHDATRLSEPQPPMLKDYTRPLTDLPNVTMVSNPSSIRFGAKEGFPGFDVLLYHGYCFDYYIANVDTIRNNGGYDRADLVMKFLLQRRHLAPAHKSTLYMPDTDLDPLVIKNIPDFFVCGHIHKVAVSSYRGVSLICGSCWQSMTSFQRKMGHHPEPARVPLVNLQTRDTKILRF